MTKKLHPAAKARTFTGVVSAVAVVGIVTAFQMSAQAQPQIAPQSSAPSPSQAAGTAKPKTSASGAPTTSSEPAVADVTVADPNAGVTVDPAATVVDPAPAPVAPADPVVVPAPAPPAPAPVAPVTPPNGNTGGSGG